MTDAGSGDTPVRHFDTSAAELRAEATDLAPLVQALVERLSAVPGLQMVVTRRQGRVRRLLGDLPYVNDLHRRGAPVEALAVTVGSRTYWLQVGEGQIRCGTGTATHRGTPTATHEPLSAWARALLDDISAQNLARTEQMAALRALVEGDRLTPARPTEPPPATDPTRP